VAREGVDGRVCVWRGWLLWRDGAVLQCGVWAEPMNRVVPAQRGMGRKNTRISSRKFVSKSGNVIRSVDRSARQTGQGSAVVILNKIA
jgi:hypothetical protein